MAVMSLPKAVAESSPLLKSLNAQGVTTASFRLDGLFISLFIFEMLNVRLESRVRHGVCNGLTSLTYGLLILSVLPLLTRVEKKSYPRSMPSLPPKIRLYTPC
jgi:hypothetical protein